MPDKEAIRRKVAHLMQMGNDERTNEFEAEAALRQAAILMRKHAIEQAELADATAANPQFDWATDYVPADPARHTKTAISWLGQIAVGLAKFTDTKASWDQTFEYGKCIKIQGEVVDVQYAVWLGAHLRDCIRSESSRYPGRRADRETFRRAMVGRLLQRMREIKAQQQEEMQAQASGSKALSIIGVKLRARDHEFGAQRVSRRGERRSYAPSAVDAGRAAGERVNFGRPIEGSVRRALK